MTAGPNWTFLSTLLQAGQRNGPRIVPVRVGSGWIMAHPVGVAGRADSVDEPTGRVDPGDIGVSVPWMRWYPWTTSQPCRVARHA